jgi:hypothetical protein
MEWLKNVKVGDEIVVDYSSTWNRYSYRIHKVEKITPTGRIKLDDGTQYQADGRKIGESYHFPLRQITPEILELIKRRELMYKIKTDRLIGMLSSERLEIMLKWQEELFEEAKDNEDTLSKYSR